MQPMRCLRTSCNMKDSYNLPSEEAIRYRCPTISEVLLLSISSQYMSLLEFSIGYRLQKFSQTSFHAPEMDSLLLLLEGILLSPFFPLSWSSPSFLSLEFAAVMSLFLPLRHVQNSSLPLYPCWKWRCQGGARKQCDTPSTNSEPTNQFSVPNDDLLMGKLSRVYSTYKSAL